MNPYYTDSAEYLRRYFGTCKVQKLSVNAGFSCPNRDGSIGRGGCSYCDNSTFTPGYCSVQQSVSKQLEAGKVFFGRKYPTMRYLAYFQSYTNTYGRGISTLRTLYEEALGVQDVVGLVIGTRPDTLSQQVVELLADINRQRPVFVEIGVETSCDTTLQLVNRGHTWADTCSAVKCANKAGLHVGVHLIMGLPSESPERSLQSITDVCTLPIESLKLHQLQIIKNTPLHKQWLDNEVEVHPYTLEEYLDLCVQAVSRVPREIAIERFVAQAPPEKVISPHWGIKNYQFTQRLHKLLETVSISPSTLKTY